MTRILSVTEYAEEVGKTPQGVRWQIEHKLLPKGVTAKKVGKTFVITIKTV